MGFFDNIFRRGKAYTDNREPRYACELTVEGQKYLLDEFDVDFDEESPKRYVSIYAVFADTLSAEPETWIMQSSRRRGGTVKFYKNTDNLEEGAVFTLEFYDAICVRCRKSTQDERRTTTLELAARGIIMLEHHARGHPGQ